MRPTKGKEKEWRFTTCQSKPVQRSQGKSATAAAAYRSGARTGERHDYRKRHGVAVDIAIHVPTEKGDQRNHHAHILATTRELENGQLTGKSDFDLSDRDHKKKGLSGRK